MNPHCTYTCVLLADFWLHVYMLSAHLKLFWKPYLGIIAMRRVWKSPLAKLWTALPRSVYRNCMWQESWISKLFRYTWHVFVLNAISNHVWNTTIFNLSTTLDFVLSDVSLDKRFQVTAWSKALVPTYSPVNNFDTHITKEVMLEFKRSSWYLVTALKLSGIPMKYFFLSKSLRISAWYGYQCTCTVSIELG